jgi:hypothetical protein
MPTRVCTFRRDHAQKLEYGRIGCLSSWNQHHDISSDANQRALMFLVPFSCHTVVWIWATRSWLWSMWSCYLLACRVMDEICLNKLLYMLPLILRTNMLFLVGTKAVVIVKQWCSHIVRGRKNTFAKLAGKVTTSQTFETPFSCTSALTMLLKKCSEWNVLQCCCYNILSKSSPCTNTCKLLLQNTVSGTCCVATMLPPTLKVCFHAQVHLQYYCSNAESGRCYDLTTYC